MCTIWLGEIKTLWILREDGATVRGGSLDFPVSTRLDEHWFMSIPWCLHSCSDCSVSDSLAACSTGAVESGSSCEQEKIFIKFCGLYINPTSHLRHLFLIWNLVKDQSSNIGDHVLASPYHKAHTTVQDLSMGCDTFILDCSLSNIASLRYVEATNATISVWESI